MKKGITVKLPTNDKRDMSLREYYAGLAMSSLLTSYLIDESARLAVESADALIKELNKDNIPNDRPTFDPDYISEDGKCSHKYIVSDRGKYHCNICGEKTTF